MANIECALEEKPHVWGQWLARFDPVHGVGRYRRCKVCGAEEEGPLGEAVERLTRMR